MPFQKGHLSFSKTKRNKVFQCCLTEEEEAMIIELTKFFGGVSKSDVLRRCIQERYNKLHPPYKGNKKIEIPKPVVQLTDEQFCEKCGGSIVKDSMGFNVCGLTITNGNLYSIPLTMRDKIEAVAKKYKII